jgi:hypothetical protein
MRLRDLVLCVQLLLITLGIIPEPDRIGHNLKKMGDINTCRYFEHE